jgi:sortase A
VRRARLAVATLAMGLAAFGVWQVAEGSWIHAKALLAQHLIARSWSEARASGLPRRPWPGADMRPVARLTMPGHGVDLFVLDGVSSRALAFGPAHVGGTAAPGTWGNTVIVAHRDTHFAFLRNVAPDDEIDIEGARGPAARYRVREVAVVDQGESRLLDAADSAQLTLITCYPFDAVLPGTRLRYVVIADRIA